MFLQIKNILCALYTKYVEVPFLRQHIILLEQQVIGSCKTLLDCGCGDGAHMKRISPHLTYSLGIDAFEDSLKNADKGHVYTQTRLMDVNNIDGAFSDNSFECVVALDLIEHLDKDKGWHLLDNMERIASKKVIVFTSQCFS